MLGCKDAVGYIPTRTSSDAPIHNIFSGGKLPKVGSTASVSEYVYLRVDPIDEPKGPYVLGPGAVVKVLEYLKTTTGNFAVVRVISDKNTRREECMSRLQCRAKFY